MTFEEARNIIAKDGFARYLVVKSESETPKYPSWNPMPCQSKAFVEAVRYLCLNGYEVLRDSEIDEYDKKHGFMTLDEAKKILKKEGFRMALEKEVVNQTGAIREFEKPEVCEAIKVANANKLIVALTPTEWDEREARLKKEYEERSNAPVPGKEQQEEKIRIICCSASPKADFYYKHFINEGNPALKESASQFNDALLDEQAKEIESLRDKCKKYADILDSVGDKLRELKAENRKIKNSDLNLEGLAHATRELKEKDKKIAELDEENERLKDQVAVIYACKENNEKYNLKQIKRLGKEIAKLNGIIHDKNAILADVAEELRLSKIREKNLTEVGQKYMKENEELKKKLADNVVDKIDAQALKSAESALAYKEKVIAEKDEVIADLGKELKEKHKKYVWYKGSYEAAQQILHTIADYAAKHPDKKFSDQMVGVDIAEEGADLTGVIIIKS